MTQPNPTLAHQPISQGWLPDEERIGPFGGNEPADTVDYERTCGSFISRISFNSGIDNALSDFWWLNALGPFECAAASAVLPRVGPSWCTVTDYDISPDGYTRVQVEASDGFLCSVTLTRASGSESKLYGYNCTSVSYTRKLSCRSGTRIVGVFGKAQRSDGTPVTLGIICR